MAHETREPEGRGMRRVLPARYPAGPWPAQMRADMAAGFLDFRDTAEFVASVKRGDPPPPSGMRGKGDNREPVWSRAALKYFVAPHLVPTQNENMATENLSCLV